MTHKLIQRLLLDLVMVALVLLEFAYRLTGSTVHELVGLSMLTLFVVHGAWNWRWFTTLFKGEYGGLRIVSMAVNVLLLITVTLMIVSGLLNSDLLFSLWQIEFDLLPRELHTASAYWLLTLMSVHLGMHWKMVMAEARKLSGRAWTSLPLPLRTGLLHVVSASIAGYGVLATIERNVLARMTAYYSFGSGELDEPMLGFVLQFVAIVGLHCYLTYWSVQLFKRRSSSGGDRSKPMRIAANFKLWRT